MNWFDFESRWVFVADMNADGVFTVSDVKDWFWFGIYAPGDGLIYLMAKSEAALRFFELTPDAYYSGWSLAASIVAWFIALGIATEGF